jgi:sn-glycerol 3-phosphate transport system substrate-binding protein
MRRGSALGLAVVVTLGTLFVGGVAAAPAGGAKAKCPLGAIKKAGDKPVEVVVWHAANQASEETLQALADSFNASQDDVEVRLINQTTYRDTIDKYRAGLSSGDLPDLVMIAETGLQQMIDSQSILPAAACVKADKFDMTDHLERVVDYYTVDGTLWPMPFNVAGPILYYDKAAFRKAGLDPERPPTTLDEVREYSQKLKDSGAVTNAGFGFKLDPWHFEQWMAVGGKPYVNHGNGRQSRATEAGFDNKIGTNVFTWLGGMVDDGLAETNGNEGPGQTDNLLGIGTHSHAMTIDSTSALGTIAQILGSGDYADIELGIAPMPAAVRGRGGVQVGGAALYIVNKSSPAKQEGAWRFAKYLNEPEQVAIWSAGTGYIPIVQSAVELPPVQERWAQLPGFKVAYDQLVTGPNNIATAGPVIGDYDGVRDSVKRGYELLVNGSEKPKAALKSAKQEADAVIQEYNERIGA